MQMFILCLPHCGSLSETLLPLWQGKAKNFGDNCTKNDLHCGEKKPEKDLIWRRPPEQKQYIAEFERQYYGMHISQASIL